MYGSAAARLTRSRFWSSYVVTTNRFMSGVSPTVDFVQLDAKWQTRWAQSNIGNNESSKPKSYVLPMFAYPSGSLHMGHLRVYTISDVLARYRRLKGYKVLHPTGWDAFGLPAENAAIERGIDPGDWTLTNIEKMKHQLKSMNTQFDWDAEIATCTPEFYRHTQKLFLMLHRKGLAYQTDALVNWDPVDKTVLANEQVDGNGRSWRSGAIVEQKMLRQWFFKITEFQQELLDGLDVLARDSKWPEGVLALQRNWIRRSSGARIRFELELEGGMDKPVSVFTTRPDTLFGVKYLALSLSHPLVQQCAAASPELQAFLAGKADFSPDSKEGFRLPLIAKHPACNLADTDLAPLPIFAAPYVLDGYGEGAVMGVPGHDTRDLAFWKKHCPNESIPLVVSEDGHAPGREPLAFELEQAFTEPGTLTALCGPYAGLDSSQGARKIVADLAQDNAAEAVTIWRLRDWLVSRQRYWGAPIPMIHCGNCGTVPVPDHELPVVLPKLDSSVKGQTGNPLDKCDEWVNTACPSCGGPAKRETDTMDTFVDSSWYYLRFPDSKNERDLFSTESASAALPVDTYIGGVEHAILHLLYARFIYKFLCREGLVQTKSEVQEPFSQLIAQGMVLGKTFSDPETGRFLLSHELDHDAGEPKIAATQTVPNISWEKMSKSKHNGVDPLTCIAKYGADVVRAHILFAAAVSEDLRWDEEKIVGVRRWLHRIRQLVTDLSTADRTEISIADLSKVSDADAEILLLTQHTLRAVTATFESNLYGLNIYISNLIKLTNGIDDHGIPNLNPAVAKQCVHALVQMVAPVAPAFAEECWEHLHHLDPMTSAQSATEAGDSVFSSRWPDRILSPDEEIQLMSKAKTQECVVQVNGKSRFKVQVPVPDKNDPQAAKSKEHEEAVINAVLATEKGRRYLTEKNDWEKRKKVVIISGGKLINFVY